MLPLVLSSLLVSTGVTDAAHAFFPHLDVLKKVSIAASTPFSCRRIPEGAFFELDCAGHGISC